MWKRVLVSIFILLLTLGGLGGIKAGQIGAMIAAAQNAPPPSASVSVAPAERQNWRPRVRAVGSVVAARGVTVSTEVAGIVKHLGFESGEKVRRGEMLVQLDASIEAAQLEAAKASLELAEVSLNRAKGLSKRNINAPAELDSAEATAKEARAQVANIEAQIAKKTIRAPFAGRLGIRKIDLGQILQPGTPIVGLQQLDDVYVDFFLPQAELGLVEVGQEVELNIEGWEVQPRGAVSTIEPSLDPASRNVQVRAKLPNEDERLRPGMFADVAVLLQAEREVIVVPATAVLYAPYGSSIYVVQDAEDGSGKVAKQVFVELGERRGDFVAVTSGLEAGATVVSSGAFKLRDGMAVRIEKASLEYSLEPKPEDA